MRATSLRSDHVHVQPWLPPINEQRMLLLDQLAEHAEREFREGDTIPLSAFRGLLLTGEDFETRSQQDHDRLITEMFNVPIEVLIPAVFEHYRETMKGLAKN